MEISIITCNLFQHMVTRSSSYSGWTSCASVSAVVSCSIAWHCWEEPGCIRNAISLVKLDFPSMNLCWLLLITLSYPHAQKMAFEAGWKELFHPFFSQGLRWGCLSCNSLGTHFWLFWRLGWYLLSSSTQYSSNSPECHDLWKIIESDQTMTSSGSLSNCKGLVDVNFD